MMKDSEIYTLDPLMDWELEMRHLNDHIKTKLYSDMDSLEIDLN